MAGYSQTALIQKLGLKFGYSVLLFGEPKEYFDWLSPLPSDIQIIKRPQIESIDFVHIFVKEQKVFEAQFLRAKKCLKKEGSLWISWPKKSSKVGTDLAENVIRDFGLANGLVDVKVCAVSEIWSGLKFMYRLKDR